MHENPKVDLGHTIVSGLVLYHAHPPMPTWYLLTCRQCSPVSPERVARLRRTRGERWAIVRVGEGELGTAPEDLEGELRAWWDQAASESDSGGAASAGQR